MLTLYDGEKVAPFPTQADDYFRKNDIYNSTALPDGGFCLTTFQGGAVIVEHDGRLRRIINQDAGLQNAAAYFPPTPIARERLWLGLGQRHHPRRNRLPDLDLLPGSGRQELPDIRAPFML